MSEDELASLALISPARTSQDSGCRVKALIQILQHQVDEQELVKEFMVRLCSGQKNLIHFMKNEISPLTKGEISHYITNRQICRLTASQIPKDLYRIIIYIAL